MIVSVLNATTFTANQVSEIINNLKIPNFDADRRAVYTKIQNKFPKWAPTITRYAKFKARYYHKIDKYKPYVEEMIKSEFIIYPKLEKALEKAIKVIDTDDKDWQSKYARAIAQELKLEEELEKGVTRIIERWTSYYRVNQNHTWIPNSLKWWQLSPFMKKIAKIK